MLKLLFLLFSLCSVYLIASPVDIATANIVADNFLGKPTILIKTYSNSISRLPIYYVFGADIGWIIVSAEDAVEPILGYSFESNFDTIDIPDGAKYWLNNFQQSIASITLNETSPTAQVKEFWELCLSKKQSEHFQAVPMISPLIQTKWNQGQYYNQFCPMFETTRKDNGQKDTLYSYAGCVAVAVGQIMKYWQYPKSLEYISNTDPYYKLYKDAQLSYCSDYSSIKYFGIDTNHYTDVTSNSEQNGFRSYTFNCNYEDMPNELTTYNYNVSRFLSTIGGWSNYGVNMDYGVEGSAAYTFYGYRYYYGNHNIEAICKEYDFLTDIRHYANTVCYIERLGYKKAKIIARKIKKDKTGIYQTMPLQDWIDYHKKELNELRPIIYSASSKDTNCIGEIAIVGHAFICDGYDSDDFFHFNWGWGGKYNGWFKLDLLNPSNYSWNISENIIVGLEPNYINYKNAIVLFPNPSSDKLNLYREGYYFINQIRIYSTTGKLSGTYTINSTTAEIDISNLSSGTYFVDVDGIIEKFIKTK